jgi:hypothetical protein
MKRLAIFLLLGPLLVALTVFAGASAGLFHLNVPGLWAFVPAAYSFAAVPALLIASADHLAARAGLGMVARGAICAAAGYALAYVPFNTAVMMDAGSAQNHVLGLAGLLPAIACSWLSARADALCALRHAPAAGDRGA